jgi:hypothetical protein
MNLETIELNNLWFDELRIGVWHDLVFQLFLRFLFQMLFFSVDEIYVLCVWFNDQTLDVRVLQFKWGIPLQRKISNYKSFKWILFDDKARKFGTILQKVFDFKWKAFFCRIFEFSALMKYCVQHWSWFSLLFFLFTLLPQINLFFLNPQFPPVLQWRQANWKRTSLLSHRSTKDEGESMNVPKS